MSAYFIVENSDCSIITKFNREINKINSILSMIHPRKERELKHKEEGYPIGLKLRKRRSNPQK